MPLNNLLCGLLETGINQLHQLDDSAINKRKQLDGTIIGINLKELNFPLYFIVSTQQVDILNQFDGQADCFIRINISALNKLQDNHQLTSLIKTGELEVDGDIQLVQQFGQLMTEMQIDWEEQLSQKIGDVLAHKLCYHLKKLQRTSKKTLQQIERQTALYVCEEAKLAPNGLAVAHFCEQVSHLDERVQQLQVKLDKLSQNLPG